MVASIIITTKDRPELLKRALKSALNQTYKDYEIIVVDDCSKEKSADIFYKVMTDYDRKGEYILHEVNKGLSAARNTGIKAARGEYVVCLDDDNELAPNFLEETIPVLEEEYFDAVTGKRLIKYKDFNDCVTPKIGRFTAIDWGWLIRKDVFDTIQYDEAMRANEDTDFGIWFWKIGFEAVVIPKTLTIAHDSENPKESLSFPTKRELDGMTYFFNKNAHEYKTPRDKWHLFRLMGRKFYRGGHKAQGLGYFWRGFFSYPNPRTFLHLLFILFRI